jgi:prepilin-type processing-associated H-X9-DG protein
MLLPALSKARDQAKKTTCLGNMKQVGLGQLLYADDSKNWLPITVWEWPGNGGGCWCYQTRDYTRCGASPNNSNLTEIMRCPTLNETWTGTGAKYLTLSSYSMVAYLMTNGTKEGPADMYYGVLYAKNAGRLANMYPQSYQVAPQIQAFANPSNSLILYEYVNHEGYKGMWGSVYNELRDNYNVLGPLGKWHGQVGVMNGAFADGHVESNRVQDMYGSLNSWSGHVAARGKMFSTTGR